MIVVAVVGKEQSARADNSAGSVRQERFLA